MSTHSWGEHPDQVDAEWTSRDQMDKWLQRCERIGQAATPHLLQLTDTLPEITSVVVCTVDGFNICSVGLDEEIVGQFAALSSSVHSVSRAVVHSLSEQQDRDFLDLVVVVAGDRQVLYITFEHPTMGELVLATGARTLVLGELLMESRSTATRLKDALAHL
ncbi:MAG: hypothetical protein CSA58_10460 [Micrococcales bacterium]|nr:MAG: hypothetical protein CSA58_10460 [Micrococcales bacterium]